MRAPPRKLPYTLDTNRRLDRWVRIGSDGTVTVYTGKVEIGQGIVSAMAQLAAEELDVAYARIRMVPVDTTVSPDEGSTSGSRSIEEGGTALRYACAEVRHALLAAASVKLGESIEQLTVDDGTIRARHGAGSVTYWTLAAEVDLAREATGEIAPKDAGELSIVGKALPRLDLPTKIAGAAFIHDIDLPGMLHGRIVRPPSYRARLIAADIEGARNMPGVRAVVREESFLGVVAEREEQAIRAMQVLARRAEWSEAADLPDVEALSEFLLDAPTETETVSEKRGPGEPVAQTLSATYSRPYLAHAALGPSCAIACWQGKRLEVWSHSQAIYPLRDELAKILGMPAADIVARHAEGAGCYGHNGADDVALDAALLARAAAGRPVRVQWMREDEFGWEPFGPAMVVKMRASLDASGKVVDWEHDLWGNRHITRPGRHPNPGLLAAWHRDPALEPPPPLDMALAAGGGSQRNAVPLYDFPCQRVTLHAVQPVPLRVSTLRALGAYANVFAIESFMDELALASSMDPVEFRLRHLTDPRARAVIERAARAAGWPPGHTGEGERGMGFGFARYKNAGNYVAVVAEVAIERTVRVTRFVAALDCGRVVNPDGIVNQAEGGLVQAASWTLKEQVRFDRTRVTSRDWDGYPILGFTETPDIEVVLIDRPETRQWESAKAWRAPARRRSPMQCSMRWACACAICRSRAAASLPRRMREAFVFVARMRQSCEPARGRSRRRRRQAALLDLQDWDNRHIVMTTPHKTGASAGSAKPKSARASSRAARPSKPNGAETTLALQQAIAEAAYYRAERRGFEPGYEVEDWLEAEREVRAAHQAKTKTRTARRSTRVQAGEAEAVLRA